MYGGPNVGVHSLYTIMQTKCHCVIRDVMVVVPALSVLKRAMPMYTYASVLDARSHFVRYRP